METCKSTLPLMLCKSMQRAWKRGFATPLVSLPRCMHARIYGAKHPPASGSLRTYSYSSIERILAMDNIDIIGFDNAFEDTVYPFGMDVFSYFELPHAMMDGDTATTTIEYQSSPLYPLIFC